MGKLRTYAHKHEIKLMAEQIGNTTRHTKTVSVENTFYVQQSLPETKLAAIIFQINQKSVIHTTPETTKLEKLQETRLHRCFVVNILNLIHIFSYIKVNKTLLIYIFQLHK